MKEINIKERDNLVIVKVVRRKGSHHILDGNKSLTMKMIKGKKEIKKGVWSINKVANIITEIEVPLFIKDQQKKIQDNHKVITTNK